MYCREEHVQLGQKDDTINDTGAQQYLFQGKASLTIPVLKLKDHEPSFLSINKRQTMQS